MSGHAVKLVLEFERGTLDYMATLFVEGVPLAPVFAEHRFEATALGVLGLLGLLGGVLLSGVYGLHILVPLMVALSSGAVLQRRRNAGPTGVRPFHGMGWLREPR